MMGLSRGRKASLQEGVRRATEDDTTALDYGNGLLSELGREERVISATDHPSLAWLRAGFMGVTGLAAGPGLVCPGSAG